MAVKLEGAIRRYIGLSTDRKPAVGYADGVSTLTAADLPAGSSFLETDTGRIFRWNGSEWAYPQPSDVTEQLLTCLVDEVRQLREVVEAVVSDE